MWTYAEIVEFMLNEFWRNVQTCYIAHVKRSLGYRMRTKRSGPRRKPCPRNLRPWIEEAIFRVEQRKNEQTQQTAIAGVGSPHFCSPKSSS